jgi:hypothetical protein
MHTNRPATAGQGQGIAVFVPNCAGIGHGLPPDRPPLLRCALEVSEHEATATGGRFSGRR